MKRKVILLAGKTSVISLPSPWIRKYGIQKGQELDIEENSHELIIRTQPDQQPVRKTTTDIRGLTPRVVRWILSALHKAGYDEIEVTYANPEELRAVTYTLNEVLLGFTIMEQTSKRCVLKSISRDIKEEFNPTLRRAFLVTLSLANSTLDHIQHKNYAALPDLTALESTNNQLTDFCERLLNKHGGTNAQFQYVIVWNLEKIADDYKKICDLFTRSKKTISPGLLDIYRTVNAYLKDYYDLFYTFTIIKLNDAHKTKETIEAACATIKPVTPEETRLLHLLQSITTRINDFSTSFIGLHHSPA